MVRLKGKGANIIAINIIFQFQYGAIKGFSASGSINAQIQFQFQYGAIKGTVLLVSFRLK